MATHGGIESLKGSQIAQIYLFLASLLCIAGHAQTAPSVGGASIAKPWETTVYFTGGPADYVFSTPNTSVSRKLRLYDAGFSLGKVFADCNKDRRVRGQFEYLVEIEPFWLGHNPRQNAFVVGTPPFSSFNTTFPSFSNHGVAVTPLLFRYRFTGHASFTPYVQLGGGLLYTFVEFPNARASRINFTPQVDFGTHIATGKKQAVVLGVNIEHVSNAGLGTINPGVRASVLFRMGYTWWH